MPLASIKDKINAIRRGTGIGSKDDLAALEKAQKLWQDMYDVATARQNEKMEGKEVKRFDKQGNPVDGDGKLIVEKTNSVDELSDDDFTNPYRSVELPKIPDNVDKAIGAKGKPVIIKKNIFEKNKANHPELSSLESRQIILNTIYNPTLIGQAQPKSRPYYWIAIESENGKSVTVLEVNNGKDNVEIVGWHKLDRKGLNKLRKQAEREDGQLLILTSDKEAAAALSALPSDVSAFKGTDSSSNPQGKIGENDADTRFSVRNSGYTTRDDGTSLSNRAKDAEDEGSFTAGKFKSRYKVSGDAFDALEKLGVVEKSEWHHTGKRFKESDFFSWKDSDHIGGDTDYGAGEQAGLHARYMENKKEIDRLAADFKKRSWEYEDDEPVREMSYDQFCGERYRRLPVLSREEYLTEDQKREKERLHAEISGNERGLSSYGRYLEHRDVDERYDGLAFENYKKAEEETLRPEYDELERENAARMERNRTLDERNARTEGKEAAAVRMLELMGYGHDDALREVKSASKIGKRQEAMERREQRRREAEAEYEKKAAVIDGKREKWLADYMKKGKVREVTRVPLGEAPENFVETKREMNGRYGWFESSARYNLPEYVSGYAFDSKRLADSYRKFDERKKDAYRELVSGADLDFDPVETARRNSEMRRSEQEETGNEAVEARLSIREEEPPKKTVKVYKLMRLGDDGKLYPLFIDAAAPTELGVWYNADSPNLDILRKMPSGTFLVDYGNGSYTSLEDYAKEHGFKAGKNPPKDAINDATASGLRWVRIEDTGKGQRRYGGESRRYWNLGINGSCAVSEFALRPGWHAGSLPTMRQIGKGRDRNLRDDRFVWVEGEVPADIDYQQEADRNPDRDIPTHIPENGYYLKATNANAKASQADRVGLYVAGAFKANRIISDAEARRVVDEYNAKHPDAEPVEYDYEREGGKPFTDEQAQEANRRFGGEENDYGMDAHKIAIDDRVAQREYLMSGNYVSSLTGDEFAKSETPLTERVAEYYAKNYDGRVERDGFGIVVLDKRGVKDSLSHGMGRSKAAAFAAVPNIIRDGVLIDQKENWKKRNYNSYTIAAPVAIGGEGYVGVAIVTRGHGTNTNKFYLHEVVLQKNLLDESIKTDTEADSHRGDVAKILKEIVSTKENVENISNSENSDDARLSVREAERGDREERTLMGVHNISERKLADAIKLGGLANPSLAVIDTKNGMLNKYGEISLIPASSVIDKNTGRNAGTVAADAYSPRFPETYRRLDSKQGRDKLGKWLGSLGLDRDRERMVMEQFDDYANGFSIQDDALVYPFLHEKGLDSEVDYHERPVDPRFRDLVERFKGSDAEMMDAYMNDREFRSELSDRIMEDIYSDYRKNEGKRRDGESAKDYMERIRKEKEYLRKEFLDEGGNVTDDLAKHYIDEQCGYWRKGGNLDIHRTQQNARDYVREHDLEKEYRDYFDGHMKDFGAQTMIFNGRDRMGRRKYKPATLDEISASMRKQGLVGAEGGLFSDGPGALRARMLPVLESLDEIRDEKGRLVSGTDFDEIGQKFSDDMFDIKHRLFDGDFDDMQKVLLSKNMGATAKRLGYDFGKDEIKELADFKQTVLNLPTEYFETKFERPMQLNEFAVAVVPEKTSADVVKALKNAGLDVRTYDRTEEGRQAVTMDAVRDRDDVRFSLGDRLSDPMGRVRGAVERVGKAEDRERDMKEQFDRTRQRGIDTADRILDDAAATDKQRHQRMTDVIREVTRIDGLRKAGKETVRERVRSIADTLTEMIPATDEFTRGEVKRLIGKIDKAMDVKDVKRNVREAVNIVLKSAERDVDAETLRLRKMKGKRLDAESQLKQGQLDLKGQHVLDEFNRVADDVAVDLDQLEQQYSGEMGNMDLSEVQRANAADKLDGVKLAQLYRESVKEKDQNISELNEMKRAEEEKIYNFRKRLVFDADGNVAKNKRTGEVRTETVKTPVIQSVISNSFWGCN